jgi:hypothetical protein
MIQLNKKQAIISIFIVLHLVFFANLYYLFAFGIKTNAEVRSIPGGYDGGSNKYITIKHNGKPYEFRTSLPTEVMRNIDILYSPSNPENFIPFTFQQMWLGRITMSLLFGLGLASLFHILFKPYLVFTFRFSPFYVGLSEKKWNSIAEKQLASYHNLKAFSTLPFVFYDFKYRNSSHFEGLYQSILKYHFNIGNLKTNSIKTVSPRNNVKTKTILELTKPMSEIEHLTSVEFAVLNLLENQQYSIAEFQVKMQQTFGKEYDKLNITLMKEYLSELSSEEKNGLSEINHIIQFIETYPTQLIDLKLTELSNVILTLGYNIQFLTEKTLDLLSKSEISQEAKELVEKTLHVIYKTGFVKK